ncbi:MAG: 23S rRNA (pseudouridine(1915)-N(3))-methyltransferase RlmH [Gammaproteobacteria bacterium CG11_big_fil_rev_8_21_14_0_20_46_22]|nr:MAG: 23S rRNA (pseudouridine(1915)-N(3))-methyltransferase RlmH [Gammaproteobacteria bacterium CG12_big_fil_rev_8_21_14_0_65_46_12]PIR10838.1 MAG: 23S rRNA (pseudouridine(1915)-N(3))-methyltransferase RlmH [Gammaproteobacteria bacterium CG11_big_fil_rev_8_21_14_0_20_46_22]
MKITLISIGSKMPAWVQAGFEEYQKRLQSDWPLTLIEIPLAKRQKNSENLALIKKEGEKMLAAIPKNSFVITLEIGGKRLSTEALAKTITDSQSAHLCFLIGGPEGLAHDVLKRSDAKISLSDLTLPHPLVRIVLAEQLYRALTITQGHPYHK